MYARRPQPHFQNPHLDDLNGLGKSKSTIFTQMEKGIPPQEKKVFVCQYPSCKKKYKLHMNLVRHVREVHIDPVSLRIGKCRSKTKENGNNSAFSTPEIDHHQWWPQQQQSYSRMAPVQVQQVPSIPAISSFGWNSPLLWNLPLAFPSPPYIPDSHPHIHLSPNLEQLPTWPLIPIPKRMFKRKRERRDRESINMQGKLFHSGKLLNPVFVNKATV